MADYVEQEKIPAYVVAVIPEEKGAGLKTMQDSKGLQQALVATDPANKLNISTRNILQVFFVDGNGQRQRVNSDGLEQQAKQRFASGKHRISKEGLSDDKALTLWWMLERGRPGAIGPLVKLAKKKGDAQSEFQQLLEVVQSTYDSQFAAIESAGPSIDGYDALESLIRAHDGLDTKAAKKLLKSFSKEKSLKDELKARGIYLKIQQLLASNKPKDQAQGKAGLGELAKRYPDTKYGKLAAGK